MSAPTIWCAGIRPPPAFVRRRRVTTRMTVYSWPRPMAIPALGRYWHAYTALAGVVVEQEPLDQQTAGGLRSSERCGGRHCSQHSQQRCRLARVSTDASRRWQAQRVLVHKRSTGTKSPGALTVSLAHYVALRRRRCRRWNAARAAELTSGKVFLQPAARSLQILRNRSAPLTTVAVRHRKG
jgi:hypothetical protein